MFVENIDQFVSFIIYSIYVMSHCTKRRK